MYHRLARTARYRWWKPLVELGLVVLFLFLLSMAVLLPIFVFVGRADDGALGLITLGVSIAVVLPATLLAARMTGRSWRTLLSVESRLRGRWFVICLAFGLAEALLSAGATVGLAMLGHPLGPAPGAWIGWRQFGPLAISVALVIPLQAAAEEFLFRGTLIQALGAWVRPPWFAILLSGIGFGLAHGLPPAGFVAITMFGLVAAWLTVETGGLEAAIALHVMNNASYFLLEAATGRADRWVTELNGDMRWSATLVDVTLCVLYGLAIARLHPRHVPALPEGTVEPPPLPGAVGGAAASQVDA